MGSTRYRYTVVFVPQDILEQLPLKEHPRLRISGEINDHPVEAALNPTSGQWYILLSGKLRKKLDIYLGDRVTVRFNIADQDFVDMPELLQIALSRSKPMKKLWDSQTPGKQRGLAYRVLSAKTEATQKKRIVEVFEMLRGERDARGKPIKG